MRKTEAEGVTEPAWEGHTRSKGVPAPSLDDYMALARILDVTVTFRLHLKEECLQALSLYRTTAGGKSVYTGIL